MNVLYLLNKLFAMYPTTFPVSLSTAATLAFCVRILFTKTPTLGSLVTSSPPLARLLRGAPELNMSH